MTIGACFVKLPQILKILKQKNVKGLSITAFELEVVVCFVHSAYCYIQGLPFNLYGEAVAALVQSTILVMMIYHYGSVSFMRRSFTLTGFLAAAVFVLSGKADKEVLTTAFFANQIIFVIARGMQIVKTGKVGDASQLSLSSFATVVLGKGIRLLTSLSDGAPLPLVFQHLLGFTVNGIVVLQILYYSSKKNKQKAQKEKEEKKLN